MGTIIINEKQLETLVKRLKNNINEGGNHDNARYMFFSNLEQMKRQCEMLLEMDESTINEILENGHDWAQDHIAEAKNNMGQVFDFLMNETKGEGEGEDDEDYEDDEEEEELGDDDIEFGDDF
jgi:HPt (histidine-containing phosphotransfer) domain-containing protein